MNKFTIRQSLLLLLTATIWGVAFVAQSVGMDYVQPFTFNAVRNLIGAAVLVPVIFLLKKINTQNDEDFTGNLDEALTDNEHGHEPEKECAFTDNQKKGADPSEKLLDTCRNLIIGGISCGVILFIASNLQQFGIQYTTVGKAGFITAMYIVLVPIIGIFLHRKTGPRMWVAVAMAIAGLYLLCMTGVSLILNMGDLLLILCAVAFSFYILVIDHFSPLVDGVKMSCIQFFTCGVLSFLCMMVFETPQLSQILAAWMPILYAGVMSCGVAYTLQIVGQRGMNPTVASLILSLESVISLLAGWLILHQSLSGRELSGCVIMFAAIVLVQLPGRQYRQ
ncbi:MAG: DMT family transporter [Lachnospiraceae bacterium]|nr:DMT family transporter [Lachnospiraceae bacterium]